MATVARRVNMSLDDDESKGADQITIRAYRFDAETLSVDFDLPGHSFRGDGDRRVSPMAFPGRQ